MDRARVVEIWNSARKEDNFGTGYLISSHLLLTAYHIVGRTDVADGAVKVRRLDQAGGSEWMNAELIWPTQLVDIKAHPERDAALFRITDASGRAPRLTPTRLGRILGEDRVPCLGLGFPDAAVDRDRPRRRDTMAVRGHVDPLHAMKSGMLTVHVDSGVVPKRLSTGSSWYGASGTAMFCGPFLVAVLATDKKISDTANVLDAVPVTALAAQPGFAEALAEHGVHCIVEDVPVQRPDEHPDSPYSSIAMTQASRAQRVRFSLGIAAASGLLALLSAFTFPSARHSIVAALAAPVVGGMLGAWGGSQFRRPGRSGSSREASRLDLLESVRQQAKQRRRQLLGGDTMAINITYETLPAPGRGAETAPPHGDFLGIARFVDDLRPKRLVITGGPGSGKTLLANEFVHQVLARASYAGPVPLPVGLAGWDTDVPFTDWLGGVLAAGYLGGSEAKARDLLASGRIMPVLDGLDEMDEPGSDRRHAVAALAQLNRFEGPLVITCRTEDYAGPGGDNRLLDCATILISDVSPADGWHYLDQRAYNKERITWLEAELADPATVLGDLLTSPWMLTLASVTSQSDAGAAALRSYIGMPTSAEALRALRAELLDQLVPTLCRPDPRGVPQRYADPTAVTRWLRLIAANLHGGTAAPGGAGTGRNLAVHLLWPLAGPRAARYTAAGLTLACWLPALVLLTVCLRQRNELPFPGLPLLLLLAPAPLLAAWNARAPYIQPRRILFQRLRSRLGWGRVGLGALLGWALVLPLTPLFGAGYALAAGIASASVFGFGLALSVRADIDRRHLMVGALPTAFVLAAAAGTFAGTLGDFVGVIAGCGAGTLALGVGVPLGLRAARRGNGGDPDPDPPGVPTPLSPLRNDVTAGLIAGLIVTGLTLYATLDVEWLQVDWPLAVATSLACGLAAGPGFVAVVTRQYTGVVLATRGRLPWHLVGFLRWCLGVGLLRSAGTVYQIRHDELLTWLRS
ncbi:hypothetical protein GQF42_33220 [Streptomyces broussonetiae]|uniref:NACHT domain-containing protein n=1 Tax=Streptomyces broussonetiae TaxID=2686304 RepID=A0A6I6NH34_9ACTN|nr:hypothetical protein [Streptomyces broussonetiae]QHA07526.1 hypothetical protein GQF42_33220 [Streptomyces broussonetiae]